MNSSKRDEIQKKNDEETADLKEDDYWSLHERRIYSPKVYPELGEFSFQSFLKKTFMGLVFSFLASIPFVVLGETDLSTTWGLATFVVSGIYFLMGGWKDTSRTSVKKSYKAYEDRMEVLRNSSEKFSFNLKFFEFGNMQEDIGAALCLLGLGSLILA